MADYKSTHTGAEIDAGIDKATTAESNWNTLMANLGIGRWANQTFFLLPIWAYESKFEDSLMPYYKNFVRYMALSKWVSREDKSDFNADMSFAQNFPDTYCNFNYAFFGVQMNSIELPNLKADSMFFTFSNSTLTKVTVKTNCTVKVRNMFYAFYNCSKLTEIGEIDLSECTNLEGWLLWDGKVKLIHCKHFKVSFNISSSTAFEEADLVEIISNLDPVTTAQTLTMGATNLAKLTDAEKQVATDKGWVLA